MNNRLMYALILLLALFATRLNACEPVIPMVRLLGGATTASFYGNSILWLFAAVAIKSVAFVVLEKRLSRWQRLAYMTLANVVSTVPGVLIAASASSFFVFVFDLPVVLAFGLMLEKRFSSLFGSSRWITGGKVVIAFIIVFLVSGTAFSGAFTLIDNDNFAAYWALKFLFVALVAATGIAISTVLEECAIGRLSRNALGNVSFYPAVCRSNYISLGFILLVAAIQILPRRLAAPHFIVSWLQSVFQAM
jgi:hypothetical protein